MALLNQIGPFLFLDLAGGIDQLQLDVEAEQRPGVDGTELRSLGIKGKPFTVRSKCDAFNVLDAQNQFYNYCQLIGTAVQPVIQYGTDYTMFGVGYVVMRLQPLRVRANFFFTGGLFPPSLGWIEAAWTLLAVKL